MVFTSPIFLFTFLPLVLFIRCLIKKEYRNLLLFIASSFFYFYGEQQMLLLMYAVIFINFVTALAIDSATIKNQRIKPVQRKTIMGVYCNMCWLALVF